jgi:RNA polymerase sigma-70 factor (ECF subfamily)
MHVEMHVRARELLHRTRSGDPEAFGLFYREHRGAVLAFLRIPVRSAELAADLMAESFVRALVAVHDHGRELPVVPIAWLVTIARNVVIDSVRQGQVEDATRQRLAIEPLKLSDGDLAEVEREASEAKLIAGLREALPEDQFEAFRARVLEDREYAEIAHDMHLSPSVVRKRVSRARARLRSLRLEARNEVSP